MSTVYLNGVYLPIEQAQVSVLDRGFLFGDGVYEVVPVFSGRTFRMAEHLRRLDNSLRAIRIDNPLSHAQWESLVDTLVERNGGGAQVVYMQVTRGAGPRRDHIPVRGMPPTVFAMSNPVVRDNHRPVSAITIDDYRWQRCNIKAIALLPNVLMRMQAVDAGAYEALLVRDGNVVEGAASNVFVVRGGVVATPPHGHTILPGVTRDLLVDLLPRHGITVEERPIHRSELDSADEVWVTGSSREIAPVTRIDDRAVGDGEPGEMWERAVAAYEWYRDAAIRAGR